MSRRSPLLVLTSLVVGVGLAVSACASDGGTSVTTADAVSTSALTTTVVSTTEPTTTEVATTVIPTTLIPTTVIPTTALTTTTLPPTGATVEETRVIGTSVNGTPITAVRRGTDGGRVVLVIGVIHGDEQAGQQIVDRLEQLDVPAGVDLWLIESMNPDGQAANVRQNANQVDLNRNFPYDWGPIGQPGDGQYAGTGPASEPETQAVIGLIDEIRPDIVIWYHQDLYRIAPGRGRDGAIRARYAELTGLPIVSITGGTYTGVAATWARHEIEPGVAFIVELGPTLSDAEADTHARAVLTIASEPG